MRFSLQQLDLIDASQEKEYDNLTSLAAELLKVPVAHVSVLDHATKRIHYKSQHGHPEELVKLRQLPMEQTYCQHVVLRKEPVIVVDARDHPLLNGTSAQKDGPLSYLGLPIFTPNGEVVGGLCMMQPETRQWTDAEIASAKKLAACVSDLIRLKAANLTSEQLRKEQREFTYAISHDLKSPANTLHMILDEVALEQDGLSPDVQDLVSKGLGTAQRMRQQVEDVLNYSRTVEVNETIEEISLKTLIEDICDDLKSEFEESNAAVTVGALPVINGSRMQMRALFQNLVSNALKFRDSSRIPVVEISASFNEASNEHSFMVKDNGIGIAAENQASIFSLFTRLHLQEEYPGTGLGLALCQRVANNHNGYISVTSDEKNGSTFTVTLPDHQS